MSKHIDIKFLVFKERVPSGQVFIEHIDTNPMIANPFIKGLHPRSPRSTLLVWVSYC